MNYGYLFYKRYYDRIDLRLFEHSDAKKLVSARNKAIWEGGVNAKFYGAALLPAPPGLPTTLPPIELETAYPGLLLGSGYAHETGSEGEFKIGFFFDHATGLPVLPGSSIKGVLRSLFPQFKSDDNQALGFKTPNPQQTRRAKVIAALLHQSTALTLPTETNALHEVLHRIELDIFESVDVTATAQQGSQKRQYHQIRDIFFDAFPVQADAEGKLFAPDFLTPHTDGPLKNPTPLQFLKIRPGVRFRFEFKLRNTQFEGINLSAELKREFFQILLEHLGVGAKTNVGYGVLVSPGSLQDTTNPPGGVEAKIAVVKEKALEKWKPNDPLTGRLVEKKGSEAYFQTDQITGCDWRLYIQSVSNPDLLEIGKTYQLSFSQPLKNKSLVQVKLISTKPL